MKLVHLGFLDIDLIPEMYVTWSEEEIDLIVSQLNKISDYCLHSDVKTNLHVAPKRYEECNKLRILPDGDISMCNSLNSTKKYAYMTSKRLADFPKFKSKVIQHALAGYNDKKWFCSSYLESFCLIDAFYYNEINEKDEEWLVSAKGSSCIDFRVTRPIIK